MFSKFTLKPDRDKFIFNPKPHRAWTVLLVIFVILLVIVSSLHFYIYIYLQDVDRVLGVETSEAVLDQRRLDRALEILLMRQAVVEPPAILEEEIDQEEEL